MPRLLMLAPPELPGENHGLQVQHVITLMELLGPRGWEIEQTHPLDPQLARRALAADLVVVHMLSGAEVEGVIRARRALGRATVYEITDNFLGLGDWSPRTHRLRSPLVRQRILYHASIADALQVYTPALAELFGAVNPHVIRFDPYVRLPDHLPMKADELVIGWGGTTTHHADLASIGPVVTGFCRRHPEATFAYMGAQAGFDAHFAGIDPAQRLVRPFGEHSEYLDFAATWHIGLAPLRASAFNAARTDTRATTYAALGVAGVLEDAAIHAPHAGHARIYDSPEALAAILEELAGDPAQVGSLARRGRAWAMRERSADVLAAQRESAYRPLLPASAIPVDDAPPAGDADAAMQLLLDAGTAPEELVAAARAALEALPTYEQAHLSLVAGLEGTGRYEEALAHAAQTTPSPVFADQFAELQARLARRVRPAEVSGHVERIRSPFLRARLTAGTGPAEHARAILAHQPYDYFALAATIRGLQRTDPDSPELDDLYARAALVAPEMVPQDRRPERLAPYLPA